MKFDLYHNIDPKIALNVQSITSNTTTNGAVIDLLDRQSVVFQITSGSLNAGTFTPVFEESETGVFSGEETAVPTTKLLGNTIAGVTFDAASDDNETKKIGLINTFRYVRLSITSAGASGANNITALAITGNPMVAPV